MYLLIYHLEPKLSSNAVQIILANTRMNEQLNIQLSQGSAATNLRGGGMCFMCGSYQNITVKELLQEAQLLLGDRATRKHAKDSSNGRGNDNLG